MFAIVVSSLSASVQFQEDLEAEILEVFKRFEEVEVLTLTEIVISYHSKQGRERAGQTGPGPCRKQGAS